MLVYTDIENSTKAAAENPSAMLVVQEVHDRVMRQGIQRFAGYEICTQGDSFEVAFATAVSAAAHSRGPASAPASADKPPPSPEVMMLVMPAAVPPQVRWRVDTF